MLVSAFIVLNENTDLRKACVKKKDMKLTITF